MQLSAKVLGKNVVDGIAARASTPLLQIGKDTFYRKDLAAIGCFNFMAASNLNAVINALQPRDTRDIYENVAPSALVMPHIGAISLAVLGAAFEAKRLGGDQPLESWVAKHRAEGASREFVTFHSMKEAERRREEGEARARKARKNRAQGRKNKAQNLRVERFTTRQNGGMTNGS